MTTQARNRSQAEDSLPLDQGLSDPQSTIENGESSRNEPRPWQQLVRGPTTAGSGAEPEAHEEASRSFLLILLRALGGMHT